MGYTQYWRQPSAISPEAWATIKADAQKLIDSASCPLAFEDDLPGRPPEISDRLIRFNGVAGGGNETFLLKRQPREDFTFCKTAAKPYDRAVCAVLAVAKLAAPDAITVSSDGGKADWEPHLKWASQVLGKPVPLPFEPEAD